MKTALVFAAWLSATLPVVPSQRTAVERQGIDPDSVDVVDAIECRLDVKTYTGFTIDLTGRHGIADRRHWKGIKSANPFMAEYELPARIVVAGRYSTRRIAFTATGIVAILDMPDP